MNKYFLEALFPDIENSFIEIRSMNKSEGRIKSHFYSSVSEVIADAEVIEGLSKHNDMYFGVCPRVEKKGDKSSIKRMNALWVDIDTKDFIGGKEEALAKINSFQFQPSIVVESGNGFHVYWLLREAEEINNLIDVNRVEQYLKGLAGSLNADLAAAELARILRLPGSLNHKDPNEIKYVRVIVDNSQQKYNLSDFDSLISAPGVDTLKPKNQDGWIFEALENLKEGNRNVTFSKIIGKLHQDRWGRSDIEALLKPHALRVNFSLDELTQEIEGICKRYPQVDSFSVSTYKEPETETESKAYKTVSLKELLLNKNMKVEWVIEGILPKEGAGIFGGAPGLGKTWLILDLAIESSRGGRWLGNFQAAQAKVLYIDEESSEALLVRRLNKLLKEKGILEDSLDVQFLIGQGLFLNDSVAVGKLRDVIKVVKPNLIIIDSLIRVHTLDENSSKDMSKIFAVIKSIIREFQCAVLFTDHQRKPGQFSSGGDVSLRGSTEKVAFVDTLLSFKRKDNLLVIEHSKSRFAEAVPSFLVEIKDLSEDSTKVSYAGGAEERLFEERMKTSGDYIKELLSNGNFMSRKDIVEKCKLAQFAQKQIDATLKNFIDAGILELEVRRVENSRGGKAYFYRLLINQDKNTDLLGLI